MQIYLSAWSLKELVLRGDWPLKALPGLARQHGFAGVELMDRQLVSLTPDDLRVIHEECQRLRCGVILDVSSDLTYGHESDWREQIEYVGQMLTVADILGADKVRILLGGQTFSLQKVFRSLGRRGSGHQVRSGKVRRVSRALLYKLLLNRVTVRVAQMVRKRGGVKINNLDAKIRRAREALQQILPRAESLKIPLVIENHWGISSDPANILALVEHFNSPYLGTCPDFDNFPKEVDRYKALRMLAGRALHVHAKSREIDSRGEERSIDYRRCVEILKEHAYDDTVTVEYEGAGNPVEGSLRTRDLILKYW